MQRVFDLPSRELTEHNRSPPRYSEISMDEIQTLLYPPRWQVPLSETQGRQSWLTSRIEKELNRDIRGNNGRFRNITEFIGFNFWLHRDTKCDWLRSRWCYIRWPWIDRGCCCRCRRFPELPRQRAFEFELRRSSRKQSWRRRKRTNRGAQLRLNEKSWIVIRSSQWLLSLTCRERRTRETARRPQCRISICRDKETVTCGSRMSREIYSVTREIKHESEWCLWFTCWREN